MVDEGIIPKDQLATAPNQNVLTQALGMPGMLKPETGSTSTRGRLLLCSDGLSDLVADDVIERSMEIVDLQSCAAELVKLALDRGGRDNITVALIELD
jgi:serine/threonine protein phosphatase PrpC